MGEILGGSGPRRSPRRRVPSDGGEPGGAAAGPAGRGRGSRRGGGLGGLSPGRGSSGGLSPGRGSPGRSPGVQRRAARVTVKYNRRELQRRLDTEQWIDGRLGELYRGREEAMPDELNIEELLELDTDEERAQRLRGILSSCTATPSSIAAPAGL
ncbi:protein phosphatase 1 regulatory subunit 14A [Cyanocitta cristata]